VEANCPAELVDHLHDADVRAWLLSARLLVFNVFIRNNVSVVSFKKETAQRNFDTRAEFSRTSRTFRSQVCFAFELPLPLQEVCAQSCSASQTHLAAGAFGSARAGARG
jgi:hypothetical protein